MIASSHCHGRMGCRVCVRLLRCGWRLRTASSRSRRDSSPASACHFGCDPMFDGGLKPLGSVPADVFGASGYARGVSVGCLGGLPALAWRGLRLVVGTGDEEFKVAVVVSSPDNHVAAGVEPKLVG